MVVEMKNSINGVRFMGELKKAMRDQLYGWTRYLDDDYLDELMEFIIENYSNRDSDLCPNLGDIFKPFDKCSPWSLRAIILGGEPKPSKVETFSIPFGQDSKTLTLNTSLKMFQKSIDSTIDILKSVNSKGQLDPTLTDWLKQGVLVLNSSPTVLWGEPGSHADLWYPFMNTFFQKISMDLHDIAFVFLGGNAIRYSKSIKENRGHLIISDELPSYYSDMGVAHTYSFFKDIDDFLMANFNETISWNERIDKAAGSGRSIYRNYDEDYSWYD